ncbi:MAG: hypothetical protein SFU83_23495 [Meiothermus sp.]|nr:hypothetical protein [Meiothermus sp.]
MTPEDARAIREELTALRLAAQANTKKIEDRFEALEQLITQHQRRPGWRLYGLMAVAMVVGWVLPH